MKDVADQAAPRETSEKPARLRVETVISSPPAEGDGFANRKLIRPSLPSGRSERSGNSAERGERMTAERPLTTTKKPAPPDQTFAENFYFQKQMQSRTPMTVVMADGEEFRGIVEWYDRDCIKLNRSGPHPNLLIYKAHIKYVFKDEGKR